MVASNERTAARPLVFSLASNRHENTAAFDQGQVTFLSRQLSHKLIRVGDFRAIHDAAVEPRNPAFTPIRSIAAARCGPVTDFRDVPDFPNLPMRRNFAQPRDT